LSAINLAVLLFMLSSLKNLTKLRLSKIRYTLLVQLILLKISRYH